MSEPQPPHPDWDSIFHRGRRRIISRILVVGAIAAIGALILFGGGLSAHKTGFLRGGGSGNNAKSDPPPAKKQKHHEEKPPQKSDDKGNHGRHQKSHSSSSDHKQRESDDGSVRESDHCKGDSAVSQQYCDSGSTPEAEPTSGISEKGA